MVGNPSVTRPNDQRRVREGLPVIRQQSRIRVHSELSRALAECQADLSPTGKGIFVETQSGTYSGLLERSYAFSLPFDCLADRSCDQAGLIDRNHMRAGPSYDLFTRS